MPDSIQGFTRIEMVTKVLDTMGRSTDNTLKARLNDDINFAQLAFWKVMDWKFTYKNGVQDSMKFTLVTGQTIYTLNTATIGYEMRNTDIDRMYVLDPSFARTIHKLPSRDLRRYDPGSQVEGFPEAYAPYKHNAVEVWPVPDANANGKDIYLDGKILPTWLSSDSQYSVIPIEYQETFLQYLLVRTLSRERDPRQGEELAIFKDMLKVDQQYDLKEVENNLRIKWPEEEVGADGTQYPGVTNAVRNWWNSL